MPQGFRPNTVSSNFAYSVSIWVRVAQLLSCSDQELIDAVRATDSDEVRAFGLYLATSYALETFDTSPKGAVESTFPNEHGTGTSATSIRNENGLHRCKPLIYMVAEDGIEPPTRGFSIPCSTN